jgi:hypothetical protein
MLNLVLRYLSPANAAVRRDVVSPRYSYRRLAPSVLSLVSGSLHIAPALWALTTSLPAFYQESESLKDVLYDLIIVLYCRRWFSRAACFAG